MSHSKDDSPFCPELEDAHPSPGGSGDNDPSFIGSAPTRTSVGFLSDNSQGNAPTSIEGTPADTPPGGLPSGFPKVQADTLDIDNTEALTAPCEISEVSHTPRSQGLEGDLEPREDSPNDLPLDIPRAQTESPETINTEELIARHDAHELPNMLQSQKPEGDLDPRENTVIDTSSNNLPLDILHAQIRASKPDDIDESIALSGKPDIPHSPQPDRPGGNVNTRKATTATPDHRSPSYLPPDSSELHSLTPGPAGIETPTEPSEDPDLPQSPQVQGPEHDVHSQSSAVDLAQQLRLVNPLELLSWTPDNFMKAQLDVVRQLKNQRSESDHQKSKDSEVRNSDMDRLFSEWETSRDISAELYPSWEDLEKERRKYEARVSELEAEVEELKAGKGLGEPPHLENPFRGEDLEDTWLRKPRPETAEDWKMQIKAIFFDVLAREKELETQRREITDYKNDLDHEKSELLTYSQRAVGDIASAARTANALRDTIRELRGQVQRALNVPERDMRERYIDTMRKVDVFQKTEELAMEIAGKVRVAESNMVGFWEGKRGPGVRAPWELIRAIKARDQKTARLEDEVRELDRRVAEFARRMRKIKQAAEQISNIVDSQSAEGMKTCADQMRALTQLVSDDIFESNDGSTERLSTSQDSRNMGIFRGEDYALVLEEDEYGNVIKMEEKFNKMKAELKSQTANLKHLNNSYKASRDRALKSLKETGETCQQLRDEIESTKAKYQGMMKDMERDLDDYQTEVRQSNKMLGERTEELQKKMAECEELKTKTRRLLQVACIQDQASGDDETNPVFKKPLNQTDKGREEHKSKIDILSDTIVQLEAKNASLRIKLDFEKRQLAVHMNAANRVPMLRGELEVVRRIADDYHRDLEVAKSRVETLEHEVQVERNRGFNLEWDKPRLEREVAQLKSELEDWQEEAGKMLTDKQELKVEIANLKEDIFEYRRALEAVSQHGELAGQDGEAATMKASAFLRFALSQRISLLHQLRDQRARYHDLLLRHNEIVSRKMGSQHKLSRGKEELSLETETERRLRDDLATAYNENSDLQRELSRLEQETQTLKAERKEHDERDPSKVWDETPAGMFDGFLKSRIKTLEKDLATAREAESVSIGLKDDAENPDPAEIKSSEELFRTVQEICDVPSTLGPAELLLTRADMANFWLHGTLMRKRLALLQAVKDGDQSRGNEVLIELDRFLLDTDLGPARDEAWGSVQYLRACFHLYATRDLAAAEEAIWRARKHHPRTWSNEAYRDMGAKLKADLKAELESQIHAAAVASSWSSSDIQ